jgi:hypothetical protein
VVPAGPEFVAAHRERGTPGQRARGRQRGESHWFNVREPGGKRDVRAHHGEDAAEQHGCEAVAFEPPIGQIEMAH